jgi:hypothetical protein
MVHQFDHRLGTYEGQTEAQANMGTLPQLTPEQHDNPSFIAQPRYWVDRTEVEARLAKRGFDKGWLLSWRDIARSSDQRTMICSAIPRTAVGGLHLALPTQGSPACLEATFNSFLLDYVARQKNAGVHLAFFVVKQLPVLAPSTFGEWADWISDRVLELTYTAWDMAPFARDLGDDGPPFHWNEDRRFLLRAELDAAFFHLYGIARDDVDYIMETFPIVKRKDQKEHGTYRTKAKILEIYDAMTNAKSTGTDYQSLLNPAPGGGPRHAAR